MAHRDLTELPELPDTAPTDEETEDQVAEVDSDPSTDTSSSLDSPDTANTVDPSDTDTTQEEPGDQGPGEIDSEMEPGTEALRTQLVQTRQELAGCKERWQRTLADFDNYRRRTERDRQMDQVRGQARLMGELLEVLDTFDKALEVEYKTVEQAREGVIRILTQLTRVLKAQGLEPVPSVGQPFNIRLHEALTTVENDEVAPDTIVEETTRGYTLKGELLRPAKVIVARLPDGKVSRERGKFPISKKKAERTDTKNIR